MIAIVRFVGFLFSALSIGAVFAVGGLAAVVQVYSKDLPSYEQLRDYRPRMLSRVYDGEGTVMAEFARERRVFIPGDEIPDRVKQAFVSAEDKNFYEHPGVDAIAIGKALFRWGQARASGRRAQLAGASGISQQVVKNFLVGDERSIERKIKEAILAVRLDGALTKTDILELYLNEIFFGARAYGIVAAAQNYFGKTLEQLELHEIAYLAALPKKPSDLHPIDNHDEAKSRRNYVIGQMAENGYISRLAAQEAMAMPLETMLSQREPTVLADTRPDYFTHEVRRQLVSELGDEDVYTGGLTVRATVDRRLQKIAARVLREALEKFDRGKGEYRGPHARIAEIAEGNTANWRELLDRVEAPGDIPGWHKAVVLDLGKSTALVGALGVDEAADGRAPGEVRLRVNREDDWIRRSPSKRGRPGRPADIWEVGDVVFIERENDGWAMRQLPEIQGGFMAMDPHTGRVLALQGGFSYEDSSFNRATQAERQPGSSFKPFVYAAALDAGYTPATVVLDAPIKISSGGKVWTPKNSSGKFYGPQPLRLGIERSRNLMTVRIAQALGMDRVGMYAERFGVYEDMRTDSLAFALGSGETTLYRMVAAYGMFANGGKRVQPTVIDRIQDRNGKTLFRHDPRYCQGCEVETFGADRQPLLFDQRSQIMDPVTAYQLVSMMRGVVERGTARDTVGGLGFPVAGKTGTTNDSKDAWFIGFTRDMVAGCYIGYDTPRPMGKGSYGGTLCGPVFKQFMREAMAGQKPGAFRPPKSGGTITIKVHRETGERLPDDAEGPHVMVETFRIGTEPEILIDDALALADDSILFGAYGADLPYILPEGEDVPLTQEAATSRSTSGGKRTKPVVRQNVGLGTGGLY